MSTSTGLREITDADFDEALERVLVPRLSGLIAGRGPGHCARITDIPAPLAERLCRRLRDASGRSAQIHVLGQPPVVAADVAVTSTKLVELRNPDAQGRQRPVLLVFIPPGVHVSAEDSFDVATFEDVTLGAVYPELVQRLLASVPAELRHDIGEVFAVLDDVAAVGRAGVGAGRPVGAAERARYLLTVGANDHDRQAAGAAFFELGLVPDFEVFTDPANLRTKVERNASRVRTLSTPDRSVRQRVLTLRLTDRAFRARLADFLVHTGLEDPRTWTRRIVVDHANWPLAFHRWPLPDEQPAPTVTIEVDDLNLPLAGSSQEHAKHPVLANITGQPYLLTGPTGPAQLPIAFRVEPDPRGVTGLAKFAVRLVSEDAGPTGVQATVKVSTTARDPYKAVLKKLRAAHLEPGWHYLHVQALDAAGVPLPTATNQGRAPISTATGSTASIGHPPEESDRFYVVADGDLDEPPPQQRVSRGHGVTQVLRQLQFAALAEGRDWRATTCRSAAWKDPDRTTVAAGFGARGSTDIVLGPVLGTLEREILAAPRQLRPWRIRVAAGTQPQLDPPMAHDPDPVGGQLANTDEPTSVLLQARATVFQAISGTDEMVLAGRDLSDLREPIIAYAQAYATALTAYLRRVEQPAAGPGLLRDLAGLLRIDTVTVDHRDAGGAHRELILIAPTHPVRMLWLLTWAELGRKWLDDATAASVNTIAAAGHTLLGLDPNGFPLTVVTDDGRLTMAAANLTPYWGVCLPSETQDPQTLLMDLATALKVAGGPAAGSAVSATALANRLERYLRMHPYVRTLVVCVINPGRGETLADTLVELERRPAMRHLTYDLRLFTTDPQALDVGEALAELLRGTWSATAEAEVFCTPSHTTLMPKLSVAVRPLDEYRSATSQHSAHVTILFDAFAGEQFDVGDDLDPVPVPVHGLVQPMNLKFNDTSTGVAWHKQPRHGRARELPDAEECSDLLAALPATIAAATATVTTGEPGLGRVPRITLSLDTDDTALLHQAHRYSDWVITIDRTLGVEYFDSPGSTRRPSYVIDYAPDGDAGLSHHIVVSSRSIDELRAMLTPMVEQHGVQIDRRHAGTFFDQLRLLSGRLAFKIASAAPNQRTEVLGLAMARLYLDYQGALQDQILVPLDAHLELYREARRRADEIAESVTLHRTDLALFSLDARRRTITCRLVEVKCHTALTTITDLQHLKNTIVEQLDRSATVLAESFDPQRHQPDRPDRPVRNTELAALLRHYLGRAVRHGIMNPEAATEAHWLLDHLDWTYRFNFTRTGLIFDLSGSGASVDSEAGVEFHRIGRDIIEDLIGAIETDPVLAARGAADSQTSPTITRRDLAVPRLAEAAFQSPARPHEIPSNEPVQPEQLPAAADDVVDDQPLHDGSTGDTAEPWVREPDERQDPSRPTEQTALRGGEQNPAVVPDVVVGANRQSPQYGIIGEISGKRIALDLNETHTISLFGVQGGGKSYTLGSIIEAVSLPVPSLNQLPRPLATIVFHYSPTLDYPPEFASMVAPNDDAEQAARLRERYGAEPAALTDVVMLVPADQVEQRRKEYPAIEVRPLKFGSGELRASHWRFLMGAVGNQSTYIRQLGRIMRANRSALSLDALRTGIDQSTLSDQIKQLAHQRLDLAADYIDDSTCIQDLIRPGRLVIVDLRDELIEKDEALGLFVVLMELFAEATNAGERFNKLVVFDEAHKYIESPDLVSGLIESVREMRHKGMSILVASQDPPSVPIPLIELSNHVILHRFTSPAWLKHLQKANAALADLTPAKLAALGVGEAYLWSNKSTDPALTRTAVKISLRPRVTRHGGGTRTAVE
ncbi:ATP-binding protein [Micromonospora sp. HM134]|uniref:methylation-associated defense system ATP-binding protein MAD8 n=1 Tax=Micromonospora sp. HM134 TaxID=2583243 RepID=UPI0011988985|nr:ATP-binding protein [Micromonospora sp. HM134]QDY06847.1 ATP-binding protein [Micromonospora sp. HM134]